VPNKPSGISDDDWNNALVNMKKYFRVIAKSIIEFLVDNVEVYDIKLKRYSGTPIIAGDPNAVAVVTSYHNSYIAPLVNHLNGDDIQRDTGKIK
jgi:hypothetical protein